MWSIAHQHKRTFLVMGYVARIARLYCAQAYLGRADKKLVMSS